MKQQQLQHITKSKERNNETMGLVFRGMLGVTVSEILSNPSIGGGVRVCGDVVLGYFWCGFAVIFILTCGIAVSIH